MCGIVGYVGKQKASPFILEGLKRLEYRGYDSTGVAIPQGGAFSLVKKTGRVANLEREVAKFNLNGTFGIGHTRWATHGGVTDAKSTRQFKSGGKDEAFGRGRSRHPGENSGCPKAPINHPFSPPLRG